MPPAAAWVIGAALDLGRRSARFGGRLETPGTAAPVAIDDQRRIEISAQLFGGLSIGLIAIRYRLEGAELASAYQLTGGWTY